ncbi:MAG: hypothetical protein JWR15_3778 [Prosthecobacter sp.]|nr:hypothetical protein [Prosthecobacter sp.]
MVEPNPNAMKPLSATLIAVLFIHSAIYLTAMPANPSVGQPSPVVMPVPPPPPPPKDPVQPPFPPAPPTPGPSTPAPAKPTEKRCSMEKPHRAHEWKDAEGRVFYCNGGVDPLPPGGDPAAPPGF